MPIFHTDEDGNWDLARLPWLEDEKGVINLTTSPGLDMGPTLSPQGWWVAFQTERDGNWEIYTMDFLGRHQVRQTYSLARDTDPAWMPVCELVGPDCVTGTLAFQSDRTGNWDIFLKDTSTTEDPFQVTTDTGDDTDPFWAPDGSALTFQSNRDGSWDIFTIRPDRTYQTQWTDNPADEMDPVWSPTGATIAYRSNRSGDWDLYTVNLRNSEESQLTSGKGDDRLQAWSPNGQWLAFQSNRDGDWEIYAYNVISPTLIRLTDDPAADEAPSWNCEGTRVLFHSDRDGDAELYSVALDDPEDVVQLTEQDSTEQYVAWEVVSEDGSLALEAEADATKATFRPPTATPVRLPTSITPTPARLALDLIEPTPSGPAGCPVCPLDEELILSCTGYSPVPVFHTDQPANWDLARLPLEGEPGIVNLSLSSGLDMGPSVSPDGWWIAFQTERDGAWEIYTMDFLGRRQTRQTYDPAHDSDPAWAPGCAYSGLTCVTGAMAFQSDRAGNWDIFLLDTNATGDPFQVTTDPGDDTDPFWAPDGSALTFQSKRTGNWDIFTVHPDGTNEAQLTDSLADEVDPIWSPTGATIVYRSNRSGDWDLYLFDLESAQESQLTSGEGDELLAVWSPNGQWLAFQSNRDGDWEIYAYNVASATLVRLTDNPAADEAPSWDYDGTRVLFHSNRDGDAELYAVALDDLEDVIQLTDQDTAEKYVAWRPVSEDGSLALEAEKEPAAVDDQSTGTPTSARVILSGTAAGEVPSGPTWLIILAIAVPLAIIVVGVVISTRRRT